jgi:drug/metabolite transporter (DMT)-like permease
MKTRAWISFWLLGLIWGSSFLLIRIAVAELKTVEVVFIRTAIAAVGLGLVVYFRRVPFPTVHRTLLTLVVIGIGNVVAPFMLITWGEQSVSSGMTAVLQSTAALFTLVVAHFAFADERINLNKIIGLILGFVGVVVLFSGELTGGSTTDTGIERHLAIVLASLCYAIFTTLGRKVIQGKIEPVAVAFTTMAVASIVTAPFAIFSPSSFTPLNTLSTNVLFAVVILGLLNTFVAYLFFYYIVRELGASRASMVTYIIPPVGVTLGALLLQEVVASTLLLGAALIFSGIAIVNIRFSRPIPKPIEQPGSEPV